jgi:hypothetical protein
MNFNNAGKQFNENRRLFADPNTAPEKYNLYAGLENLAIGLANLQVEVEDNKRLLSAIIQALNRR